MQRYADTDQDARFGVIEQQLLSLLRDLDYLVVLAEQRAFEELLALSDIHEQAAKD